VLVFLDLSKALKAGIKFYVSENGVVLTEGNEQGLVPIDTFKQVEERGTAGNILVTDGTIVGQVKGIDRHGGRRSGQGGPSQSRDTHQTGKKAGSNAGREKPQLVVDRDEA
jgi:2'-phosphotransferase